MNVTTVSRPPARDRSPRPLATTPRLARPDLLPGLAAPHQTLGAMRHRELSQDFWNHARSLPRARVLDLVTSMTAEQTAQGGVNARNRIFLQSFREHLSTAELQQLQQRLQHDPNLNRQLNPAARSRLLQDLRLLWGASASVQQPPNSDSLNPNDARDEANRFFFQQTLLGLDPTASLG